MYIIHENELIHVDTGSEVLEHYGVKGMKWGKRMAGYAKSLGKAYYNQYRHPILSAKASMSAFDKSPGGQFVGTKRSLDYQNRYVDAKVSAKLNYKKKLNDLKKNKYKKADAINKPIDKQLDKAYAKQDAAYFNLEKNKKLRNYLTKDGRNQRAEAKKEYKKASAVAASLEDKAIKNYSAARKQYKLDKKKLKDELKNATSGLRY